MRSTIAAIIRAIEPYDSLEQEHRSQTIAWVESGVPLCRIAKPATPPQHLVSYFVLYDSCEQQILLVDHKTSGLWLPSGGHVEPDEHPATTVLREAQEELRIAADFLFPQPLFLTITQTVGTTAGHTDISLWYVLRGDSQQLLDFDHNEFHQTAWFAVDKIPYERTDPHMARFVRKLNQRQSSA